MGTLTSDGEITREVDPVYIVLAKGGSLDPIFPTHYSVKHRCKLLGSPSEKGVIEYDNKVVQPTIINFTGIIKNEFFDKLETLQKNLLETRRLEDMMCTVYTKAGTYEKMILQEVEEVGESNRYDAVEARIVLEEYLEHS